MLGTEEGVDRAFKMLDRIKPLIECWDLGEEPFGCWKRRGGDDQRLQRPNLQRRRARRAVRNHLRQLFAFHDIWSIPTHTKNLDAALAFVRFATSTRSLANQAKHITYGPLRKSSLKLLSPEIQKNLPTAPGNVESGFATDAQWWGQNLTALQQRFERWAKRSIQVPKELPGR